MPSAIGQCPPWCARDHNADAEQSALYHAGETVSVSIGHPVGGVAVPHRLDVQAVQHLPDDPAEPSWPPAVEIAMHTGGRYRLIGLSPGQARELASALTGAADMLSLPRFQDRAAARHQGADA
jgi:hypothetical protein